MLCKTNWLLQKKTSSHIDEFEVAKSSFVRDAGEMWISLLAVLPNDLAVVVLILAQEPLRIVVAVDVDLGERIVGRRFDAPFVDSSLQPRQKKFQSVTTRNKWGIQTFQKN